jgi:hypothetical protein
MKRLLSLAVATSALALMAPTASAQVWVGINQRQAQIDQRIEVGVNNGALTGSEAARLRGEFNDLARLEAQYRRDGLSASERSDLDVRFDRLNAQVRSERQDAQNNRGDRYDRDHDRDDRYDGDRDRHGDNWRSINQRQAQLEARINEGRREGSLTNGEARRLRAQFQDIAQLEVRYRRNGLSAGERRDLDMRFDRLSARIEAERHDWNERRGRRG